MQPPQTVPEDHDAREHDGAATPPRRPWRRLALREGTFVVGVFLAYEALRLVVGQGVEGRALANAASVMDVQANLGLAIEPLVQATILGHDWLVGALNQFYLFSHLAVTLGVLVGFLFRQYPVYTQMRDTLLVMTVGAFALHWAFPLAPPRLVPHSGVVDTLGSGSTLSPYASESFSAFVNQYAAMPSLHMGWAIVVALMLVAHGRSPWRHAWLAYPCVMLVAIVATGNHFVLDALVAAAMVPLSLGVLEAWEAWARPTLAAHVGERWWVPEGLLRGR